MLKDGVSFQLFRYYARTEELEWALKLRRNIATRLFQQSVPCSRETSVELGNYRKLDRRSLS